MFVLASVGSAGCDQWTKGIARSHLEGAATTTLAGGTVELLLVENPGAFMSLGAALPEEVRRIAFQLAAPLALLVLCFTLLRQSRFTTVDAVALALVVGGGAGNWLDRVLREGAVTDFVRVGVGPLRTGVFNLADVAILAGLLVLVLRLRSEDADPSSPDPPPASA